MRLTTAALTAAGLTLAAVAPQMAAADAKIYPYHGANYCPAGLQPITISGVICCGTPNQHISYAQAKAHPVKRHRVAKAQSHSATAHCKAGHKGCD